MLKPAYEPIVLARRPLAAPVEHNIRRHGTGALNIDSCRVSDSAHRDAMRPVSDHEGGGDRRGRWPANVTFTHAPGCTATRCASACPVGRLDRQAATGRPRRDCDGPSRFFYCAKASRRERDAGCDDLPGGELDLFPQAGKKGRGRPRTVRNPHPTVKPLELMRWLVRLTTPPGGLVLDPFCGSGTTGIAAMLEHRRFHGIELDPDTVRIARARIAHWSADDENDRHSDPFDRRT
jgi:site-specific DNA-methyltransferase (adenine-specific)